MKRLLLLLMLVSQPVWAEWVAMGTTRGGTNYYWDPATVRKTAEGRRVWMIYSSEQPQTDLGTAYRSSRWLEEFDCVGERTRALQWTTYSGPMLGGTSVNQWSGPGPWQFIPPNSVGDHQLQYVCKAPLK